MSTFVAFLFSPWAIIYGLWAIGGSVYVMTHDIRKIRGFERLWDHGYQRRWDDFAR